MNIFSIYFEKIKKFLIDLEKNKQIKISADLNKLTIELTPKNLQGDISCNAALVLSKINNKKPKDIAILLKTNLIKKFPEFKNIFIVEPGFLNIEFHEDFWQKFLNDLLNKFLIIFFPSLVFFKTYLLLYILSFKKNLI